jgi:hypothetical protein
MKRGPVVTLSGGRRLTTRNPPATRCRFLAASGACETGSQIASLPRYGS